MVKKAVLVEHTLITRIIVDIPETADITHDKCLDMISELSCQKIVEKIKSNPVFPLREDITKVSVDLEVPYKDLR